MEIKTIDKALLEKVNSLNLEPIIFKLTSTEIEGEHWSLEMADETAELYKKFLILCHLYPGKMVPSKKIDAVWHHHILDTEKYDEDCQNLFGYKIHHFPYSGMRGGDDKNRLKAQYETTKELFRKHFSIESDLDYGMCGDSPSDCNGRTAAEEEIFLSNRPVVAR